MRQNNFLYKFLFLFLAFLIFVPFSQVLADGSGSVTVDVPANFCSGNVQVTVQGTSASGSITSSPITLSIVAPSPTIGGIQGYPGYGSVYTNSTQLVIYGTFSTGGNSTNLGSIAYNNDSGNGQLNVAISSLSAGSHSITITDRCGKTVTSSFNVINPTATTYTVAGTAGAGGTITPTSQTVNQNATATLTVAPNFGYSVSSISGCGGSLSGTAYTTGAITSDCTVTVSFSAQAVNGVCSANHYNCSTGTSGSNVDGTSAWTWMCNGSNGGTNASCSENKSVMTGTLSAGSSTCTITSGANSCMVSLTWSTTNPEGTSAVTASGMTNVNGNSGSQSFTVPYGSRIFYLYNNGKSLVPSYESPNGSGVTVTSGCVAGTAWDGSKCASSPISVNISASPINITLPTNSTTLTWSTTGGPDSCTASNAWAGNKSASGSFETINGLNTAVPYTFTITCSKSGTTNVSASAIVTVNPAPPVPVMSGNLSPESSNCTITAGASSCTQVLTWTTTNPEGTSAVTSPTGTPSPGTSVNNGSQTFTAPRGTVMFYLYNNAKLLDQSTVVADCAPSNDFVSGVCRARPTITATQSSNGSITPSGVTSVIYGSDQSYTITPNSGYYVSSLVVDGSTVAGSTSKLFSNVTSNHTISATFAVSACGNGATNSPTCNVCPVGSALVSGYCTPITVSVAASTPYNTSPNTNVSFAYNAITNSGSAECRLLDNTQAALTSYQASSPIVYSSASTAGPFDYYVRCRNTVTTSATATSNAIRVNVSAATTAPTVTTNSITNINQTTATGGGNVTSNGGATVTVSGIAWSTSANPTTANSKTTDGWALGAWSDSITGLTANTNYHVRAYATNSVGTSYGSDVTFTTLPAGVVNNSTCTSITAPSTVTAGQVFSTTVVMQNSGTKAWANSVYANRHELLLTGDTTKWNPQEIALPASTIDPGTAATFSFNVTAPATPGGPYNFNWQMIQQGVASFGATCTKTITVTSPNVAVCDGTWRNVPGGGATQLQPIVGYMYPTGGPPTPHGSITQFPDSIAVAVSGGDIWYQACRFNNTSNCTWDGSWTAVVGSGTASTQFAPYSANAGDGWDIFYKGNDNYVYGVSNYVSGSNHWFSIPNWTPNVWGKGSLDSGINWGQKFRDQTRLGAWWQVQKDPASNNIQYSCSTATPSIQTCVNVPLSVPASPITPSSVAQNGSFTVLCDFGVKNLATASVGVTSSPAGVSCINPTGNNNNTRVSFSCTAPNSANSYAINCNTNTGSADNLCSQNKNIGTLTVTSPALPNLITLPPSQSASAIVGVPLTFTSTILNLGSASTLISFNNLFQVNTVASGVGASTISVNSSAAIPAGNINPVTSSSYTFGSTGSYYVRTCADNDASFIGKITESDETDNCSSWKNIFVDTATNIDANPTTIYTGGSTTLTWTSSAASCTSTGTGFNISAPSGSVVISPTITTTYTVTCGGSSDSVTVTVKKKPKIIEG